MSPRTILVVARTLAIALAGGFAATAVGLPAGWMSGAMIAVTIAALARLPVLVPLRLIEVVFIALGVILGSGITPEIAGRVGTWPISLASVLISLVVMVIAVQAYLMKVAGWDRTTAFFAAVPGAFSYIVVLAVESGADLRRVAVSQSIRVFLLVAAIPALVTFVGHQAAVPSIRLIAAPIPLAVLLVASLAGSLLFAALRIPAGLLSGALIVSGVAHAMGWVVGGLPDSATIGTYVVLGAMIGCRFVGAEVSFIRKIAVTSFSAFLISVAVAAIAAALTAMVIGEPVAQIVVAFAPGGLDAMMALALALHMDSAFVAAHQLARFIAIAFFAPFAARAALGRPVPTPAEVPEED